MDTDPDIEFGMICNGLVQGLIYDQEVKIHSIFNDIYLVETSTGSDEDISIGLSVLESFFGSVEIDVWETTKASEYRYATTVVIA